MWKLYSRFYYQILKKESSLISVSKNLFVVPKIKRARLVLFSQSQKFKEIMASLFGLQIFVNLRANFQINRILITQETCTTAGAVNFGNKESVKFLHFLIFFSFPKIDSIVTRENSTDSVFRFFKKIQFPTLFFFRRFFPNVPKIESFFYFTRKRNSEKISKLFRLFKLPVIF